MSGWTAVLAACLLCFTLKLAGYLLPQSLLDRPAVTRVAGLVTVGLLASLVAVQTFGADESVVVDARLAALAAAAVALLLRAPFVVVVIVGAATAGALRAAGVS